RCRRLRTSAIGPSGRSLCRNTPSSTRSGAISNHSASGGARVKRPPWPTTPPSTPTKSDEANEGRETSSLGGGSTVSDSADKNNAVASYESCECSPVGGTAEGGGS